MATKRDYYDVLGVQRDATEDDVRRAYRRLARQYHPDVNSSGEAETRFKEVTEAYEVLCDQDKRRMYDRFGHNGPESFGVGGMSGFGFPFEDIFESFFGSSQSGRSRRAQRGADLRYDLKLSFEEAVFGCEKVVEVTRAKTCAHCSGNGAEPGTQPIRCTACNGSGEQRRVQSSIFGQFVNVTLCERCRGEGQVIGVPCSRCQGQGRVRGLHRLSITVPPGVDEGQQIRLNGEGESGPRGGLAGDLYVFISVTPHSLLKRQGDDLLYDLRVNVAQAALGDEVEVPTVDGGTARVKVPAGTETGKQIRLRDQGVPHLRRGGRGDQIIRVKVATPQRLTEDQRKLFQALASTFGSRPPDGSDKGIFEKVKDVLSGGDD